LQMKATRPVREKHKEETLLMRVVRGRTLRLKEVVYHEVLMLLCRLDPGWFFLLKASDKEAKRIVSACTDPCRIPYRGRGAYSFQRPFTDRNLWFITRLK